MKVTSSSLLWVGLSTLTAFCHGRAQDTAAAASEISDIQPQNPSTTAPSSAAAAATSGAPVCKRDYSVQDDFIVVREPKGHQLVKRIEKNIPGMPAPITLRVRPSSGCADLELLGTNPLVSALRNIPGLVGSATGVVTNRLAHDGINKHSLVVGLKGTANFFGKIKIDGQIMSSPMPWIVRWDFDPIKGA